ncbi:MAG: T9SS type A sorting domain-containing protein [candidate division WOR-3 bacterium]
MIRRLFLSILALVSIAIATRIWSEDEIQRYEKRYKGEYLPRPETTPFGPRRFNYLKRKKWVCEFVARYQVSDSLSPDFGGIIEAEHLPTIIETDNTQEAIWVWSRHYQITGSDYYQENIRRAWIYVLRNPAYREHGGNPGNIWYAVWNCGLGLMAESKYRQAYQDSSYLFYADSCRDFYLKHPLNPNNILENFVTAQASGMAYDYALERNDQELLDTALARGTRVKNWIEENARSRLAYQSWAMCGGTAFWGVCHTFCKADTVAGKAWIETYAESLPGFYPSGTWNCSHNIWLANAYRAAAEIGHNEEDWEIHQYLTDTLLMRDTDLDGGIPATWTDPNTQDQTWVSTYLDFMGLDVLFDTIYPNDLCLYEFISPSPSGFYIEGDTVTPKFPIENVGLTPVSGYVHCRVDSGYEEQREIAGFPPEDQDTLSFPPVALERGVRRFWAYFTGDSNPKNDSIFANIKVYGRFTLSGLLLDSVSSIPILAWVKAYLGNDTTVWDSCLTNRSGGFSLNLIDSTFRVTIEPEPPYYRRSWTIPLTGDTNIVLLTSPAEVMIVNNDSLENYSSYYTSSLDSLNVSWCLWKKPSQGPVPYDLFDRLEKRTVIWFTGNTRTQTVPVSDQESLANFILRGGNLLLTGQNIAEELAGTHFLENIIGCRFDSSGYSGFLAFGNRSDSLGRNVIGTATAGGNGANNQTSRDIILPLSNATLFMVYDTVTNLGAGIRREAPFGAKVIFLGFGFEAVNRPASRPQYWTRTQLMGLMLDWLFAPTGIAEKPLSESSAPRLTILPRVFQNHLLVKTATPVQIALFDITGREVATFYPDSGTAVWNLSSLPTGIYFARTPDSKAVSLVKVR